MKPRLGFNLDCMPVPVLVSTEQGDVVDANQRAAQLLGEDLLGRRIEDIIDFSRTDLNDCCKFIEVIEKIKSRTAELNTINVEYSKPYVSRIDIRFSFYEVENQNLVFMSILDASERKRLIETFEYKQNLLDNIVSTSTDALIVYDSYGGIELFSPAAESMFGKTSTEMIIEDIFSLFDGECHQQLSELIDTLKSDDDTKQVIVVENLKPIDARGGVFPASITLSKSHKDRELLIFMVVSDKSLFQRFVNSVNDAYVKTGENGHIIDLNNKMESLFQYEKEELIGKHFSFLGIKTSGSTEVISDFTFMESDGRNENDEYLAINGRGKTLDLNLTVWPQEINSIRVNNVIIRDVTQKKQVEKQLIVSAFTDTLTKLSNRANFNIKLSAQTNESIQSGKTFSLLLIDLDKFKEINDSYGHDYGDELLVVAAKRLVACVRSHDLVSRVGGDEFTIIVREVEDDETVQRIAERILKSFRREFTLKGKHVTISASIGIANFPNDAVTPEELLKSADMAMYSAKRSGKDAFRHFDEQMFKEYERAKIIERELRGALENEELSLHYQPKVSIEQARVVGFEALLRWNNPTLGFVSPAEFIPIAEEISCIVDITKWVLATATSTLTKWIDDQSILDSSVTIAVNISADHFKCGLFDDLERVLDQGGFDPTQLEIEITESTLMDHTDEVVKEINRISDLGVNISMDDFGTGYSSLQYLKYFDLHTIKIDRSFVRNIHKDNHNVFIIESIITIVRRLSLNLVAEGVENEEELLHLASLGCDVFQGFYFSRPVPEEEVPAKVLKIGKLLQDMKSKQKKAK